MHTQPPADIDAVRFRGATLDEAIGAAELELGPRVRVLSANHIRRGGIGGFFASDLGVEVCVAVEDETVEEAFGRIVEETAIQERDRWRDRVDDDDHPAPPDPASSAGPVDVEPVADARRGVPSFAETLRMIDPQPAPIAPTPHDAVLPASIVPAAIVPAAIVPAAPRSAARVAEPSAATRDVAIALNGSAAVPAVTRLERLEAAFASLRENPAPIGRAAGAPTRRQVELAVAAAEQLMDGIDNRGATEQMSVRVVMRATQGAAIEIDAQWSRRDASRTATVAS